MNMSTKESASIDVASIPPALLVSPIRGGVVGFSIRMLSRWMLVDKLRGKESTEFITATTTLRCR